jgi:hypothetical protein
MFTKRINRMFHDRKTHNYFMKWLITNSKNMCTEDGSSRFLRIIGNDLADYMTSYKDNNIHSHSRDSLRSGLTDAILNI